jgi:L-ribulose-5-phosphate 3-epimerase UlaE
MSNNEILELKAAIMELTVNIKHMDTKQDEMLQDVKSIKEAIYNPETGLYARVRSLEQWQSNMSKVIWSVGLGFIGLLSKAVIELI